MKMGPEMDADPWLTVPEFAEFCGVAVGTVYNWNTLGVGPSRMKSGRTLRIRQSDAEAFLKSREVYTEAVLV